jgi:hypothetical protein
MMDFKVSDDAMRAVVSKAWVEAIAPEQQTLIIQSAIEHLIGRASPDSYSDKRTVVEKVFHEVAQDVLSDIAHEEMMKTRVPR